MKWKDEAQVNFVFPNYTSSALLVLIFFQIHLNGLQQNEV